MSNLCRALDELSTNGNWDDVFYCLNIDANSTVELGSLRVPGNVDDSWLDKHKTTTNSLEAILYIILLFDQIFFILLLWYLLLFALKYLRYRGPEIVKKLFMKLKEQHKIKSQGDAVKIKSPRKFK